MTTLDELSAKREVSFQRAGDSLRTLSNTRTSQLAQLGQCLEQQVDRRRARLDALSERLGNQSAASGAAFTRRDAATSQLSGRLERQAGLRDLSMARLSGRLGAIFDARNSSNGNS